MAVDIRDTEVSPLNASLLSSLSCQLDPRHPAGSHRARSPTPALSSACRSVTSWLISRCQPGQQSRTSVTRSKQLASFKKYLRPAEALNPSALDSGGSKFSEANFFFFTGDQR